MTTEYREFLDTYERFKAAFPDHPLNEQILIKIMRRQFPSDQWLADHTRKMKALLAPEWQKTA